MGPKLRFSRVVKASFLVAVLVLIAAVAYFTSRATNKRTSSNTFAATPTQVTLTANGSQVIGTFSNDMLGIGMGTWEYAWGKPFPNDPSMQKVNAAFKKFSPGYVRYAGGNWVNNTGWDRRSPVPPASYDINNNNYYHLYTPAEIDSVVAMARSIGADVMIEVNLYDNDPAMWADLVHYANIEKSYGIKYWELGNENEASWNPEPLSTDTYLTRAAEYERQMKLVDNSIIVVGNGAATPNQSQPVDGPSQPDKITRQIAELPAKIRATSNREIGGLTWHWYLSWGGKAGDDVMRRIFRYNVPGASAPSMDGTETGRIWPDIAPKRIDNEVIAGKPILQGITELNTLSANKTHIQQNHVSALFLSDAVPRFAANGIDFASIWLGYSQFGSSFAMIQHDGNTPTNLRLNSPYYVYYMLANYFGDQILSATSSNMDGMSVWASRDSKDPGKIKLMITNFTDTDLTATLAMQNFAPQSGVYYELLPDSDLGSLDSSGDKDIYSNLNGKKIDINDLDNSLSKITGISLPVAGTGFTRTFPKYSVTSVILTGAGGGVTIVPTTGPTATPTLAPGQPTPTRTPTPTTAPTPIPPTPTPPGPTPTGIIKPITDKFATISRPTPAIVAPGQNINLAVEVVARDAGTYLIDIEVYNANGDKVNQWVNDNQAFTAQQTKTYPQSWSVPASLAIGTYTVKVGVFSTGWTTLHNWNNEAGTFIIRVDAPVSTSTPVPPTSTPTRTPTPTTVAPTLTRTPTPIPPTATRTPTPSAVPATSTTAPTATGTGPATSPTGASCPKKSKGDANCDGKINMVDFSWWLSEFTEVSSTRNADFDGVSSCTKADGSAKYTCMPDKDIWGVNFLN